LLHTLTGQNSTLQDRVEECTRKNTRNGKIVRFVPVDEPEINVLFEAKQPLQQEESIPLMRAKQLLRQAEFISSRKLATPFGGKAI